MRHFWILTGPTGTGKSELALRCAESLGTTILSVDSMLVYRGLDIGTAKPSSQDRTRAHHHLVDVVDPWTEFNALQFKKMAEKAWDDDRGRTIGAGGTPFYIKALRDGLSDVAALPHLEKHLALYPESQLRKMLQRLDSKREHQIAKGDVFRLIRALTLIFSSGQKATDLLPRSPQQNRVSLVALHCDRQKMHRLLEKRIDAMFRHGLFEEALRLYNGPKLSRTALGAVGYKELFAHFRGEISLERAREKILIGTRRLFKHQMTWLRKMEVTWVEANPLNPELAWPKVKELALRHFEQDPTRSSSGEGPPSQSAEAPPTSPPIRLP